MNLGLLLPEYVAAGALLLFVVTEIASKGFARAYDNRLAEGTALAVFLASIALWRGGTHSAFGGMFILDSFAVFFKSLFALILFALSPLTRDYFRTGLDERPEFFLILWIILIGLFFLVSANDFLVLFIALETVTLSFYILTAYLKNQSASIEAGLKYLILGSLASAFVVFGIALIYTAAGSTLFADVRLAFQSNTQPIVLRLGLLFLLSGLGFKVAAAPFHLWVPDVYEGAPTPAVAFLATGSKTAGFAVLMRVLFTVFPSFNTERAFLFSILAGMTLLYGNLGALLQTNVKRLFGYSSIAHAGYLLIGIAVGRQTGLAAILYYLAAYVAANLASFWVIALVGRDSERGDHLESYRGLAKRSPFLAGIFFTALLSLAGVPPLAGFFGKFLILLFAVQAGLTRLALLGSLLVAVSLFYYLTIVRKMYFEEPLKTNPIPVSLSTKIFLAGLIAILLILGLFQAPLLGVATSAAKVLF